jgi:hypothetical protein
MTRAVPDRSVPYRLTAMAYAVIAPAGPGPVMDCGCGYDDCSACAGYGWACLRCGAAFFGATPEDGLCPACGAAEAER